MSNNDIPSIIIIFIIILFFWLFLNYDNNYNMCNRKNSVNKDNVNYVLYRTKFDKYNSKYETYNSNYNLSKMAVP